jgi:hypothetical protein
LLEGEWKAGKLDGKGKTTLPNGVVYEGDYVAGSKTGEGTAVYANGGRYSGEWEANQRSGVSRVTNRSVTQPCSSVTGGVGIQNFEYDPSTRAPRATAHAPPPANNAFVIFVI